MFPGRLILGVGLITLGCSLLIASPLLPYWQLRHQEIYSAMPHHNVGIISGHLVPRVAENLAYPKATFFTLTLSGAVAIQTGVYLIRKRSAKKRLPNKLRTT